MSRGSIEVITGPMFSGKSTELMRRLRRYEFAHHSWQVFKPTFDTRSQGVITHDEDEMSAIPIDDIWPVFQWIEEEFETDVNPVIAVDEMHFLRLGRQEIEAITLAAIEGTRFIFAGLDTDQAGHPFRSVAALMAISTDLVKLTAVCRQCGDLNATRSQWIADEEYSPITRVGAADKYEPKCIACFEPVSVS